MERDVILDQPLDLKKLMAGGAEFRVDTAFKEQNKNDVGELENDECNHFEDDGSDDDEQQPILCTTPLVQQLHMDSPSYVSFDDLAQNMIDLLPSGYIKMLIVSEGKGPLIPEGAKVWLRYALYWEFGTFPFDSSLNRIGRNEGPLVITLGCGKILPAIELCIKSLRGPQACAHFLLSHQVTWGEMGVLRRIPGGKTCLLVLRIENVEDCGALDRFDKLDEAERQNFSKSLEAFEIGNTNAKNLFTKKAYNQAIKVYHRCMKILRSCVPTADPETKTISASIVKTLINLAVCYNKLNMCSKAILMMNELSSITSLTANGKALYQYALAHENLGELEEASRYYTMALKVNPQNSEVAKKLVSIDAQLESYADAESSMWKTAFGQKAQKNTDHLDESMKKMLHEICESILKNGDKRFEVPLHMSAKEIDSVRNIVEEYEGLEFDVEIIRVDGVNETIHSITKATNS